MSTRVNQNKRESAQRTATRSIRSSMQNKELANKRTVQGIVNKGKLADIAATGFQNRKTDVISNKNNKNLQSSRQKFLSRENDINRDFKSDEAAKLAANKAGESAIQRGFKSDELALDRKFKLDESAINRNFKSRESALDRGMEGREKNRTMGEKIRQYDLDRRDTGIQSIMSPETSDNDFSTEGQVSYNDATTQWEEQEMLRTMSPGERNNYANATPDERKNIAKMNPEQRKLYLGQ